MKPVKTFVATFFGREAGALGICYRIVAECFGVDEKEALLDLYKKYEHISEARFVDIPPNR